MQTSAKTRAWWGLMVAIAITDLSLWLATAALADTGTAYAAWHLRLSGVYATVCAFRAVVPRIDLERTVLFDHPISSMVVGRGAATVAEICFGVQMSLALHELGALVGLAPLQQLAPAVAVALTLAQVFCWVSVVTLNNLGHVIEESIWGLTFAVLTGCVLWAWPLAPSGLQPWLLATAVATTAYVAFMFLVDVPMYLRRWRAQPADGSGSLSFAEGWSDALHRRVPTWSWDTWRPEVAWLTGYFSLAVWASIGLVWLPR